jgi:hypothetical protein
MLAIEYSTREFFNMLITVQWEWLLATIILTGKLLKSRLESRSHKTTINDGVLLSAKIAGLNAQPLRGVGPSGPEAITRNSERATRNP